MSKPERELWKLGMCTAYLKPKKVHLKTFGQECTLKLTRIHLNLDVIPFAINPSPPAATQETSRTFPLLFECTEALV